MSEVGKVKNVRPLTCELLVELRLQNGTRMLLIVGLQIYERTRNECASEHHTTVLHSIDKGAVASAFTASFVLLCGLHALLILAAVRLPLSLQTSGHDPGRASLKLKSV